jgi:phage gp16-like protein
MAAPKTPTKPKSKAEQLRAMDIKLIKMGQAQLGWDDAFYREVLASHFGGKASATDLTWQERQQLIGHMKRLGFVVKTKGRTERADDTMSKLRAMWFAMAEVGAVNKRPMRTWPSRPGRSAWCPSWLPSALPVATRCSG